MRDRASASGWRGVALIAVVYVYFLIFAQFAFLTRLAELGVDGNALKMVMAAMAAGGILFSLLTPRLRVVPEPARRLRVGLAICAVAALLTLLPLGIAAGACVAFLIGAGLGITTVTLVTHLRQWTGDRRGIVYVGLGTGIAYLICNVPPVFTAAPEEQAILAATLCLIAMLLPLGSEPHAPEEYTAGTRMSFPIALVSFAALIWLDSAAFFIIQHTPALKSGTWLGSVHLWTNGALHFLAALASAALVQSGRARVALALAFAALGFACVLLQHPALILSASLFYPVGVSFYSVALVAYPSFLTRADSPEDRGRQAGWIYAIAGWMGSALGIGMGQNLGHVPLGFVVVAGCVVLAPVIVTIVRGSARETAVIAGAGAVAFVLYALMPQQASETLSPVERGRQIYISEGCISCHSQYVRPNSPDVAMWGPTESMEELHAQKPPLIGNRRQGPDLSQVGLRRSALWLKAHLMNPAEVSYGSPMPSYAFLFADGRGNDLVAYLSSLHGPGEQLQREREEAWSPTSAALASANADEGRRLYQRHCATCHDAQGATRLRWLGYWRIVPQTLPELRGYAAQQTLGRIAVISRFGVFGTDMPGHEYLNDQQIASVALFLKLAPMQDVSQTSTH
ncbi:cbb3-type cytochrome c oxidase subunit II [Occallatibacter savannae]|uniref:cbb3-type cytochrome c oxidase subunit II n=1 Tax=Occallatibacter savannae TaxID=1002691 RepID=UPI000D69BD0A|nr:cbb3-type cytochrome c oxidase subunit II [Occallatibacter savannae]